jgi:toxin-antitoxin system PIN domain toxin
MRALLDINVLIALLDADHPHHSWATHWLKENIRQGWASCPITQNGCVRIMSQPGYPNHVPPAVIVERLREAVAHTAHQFWPDDASLLDRKLVDENQVHGPRQVTDAYLLALAVEHKGRFVTFDGAIALSAVPRASGRNLLVLRSEAG